MTSRRKFLKILGGGTIFAAAGAAGFVATRTPTAALAPWAPATYDDLSVLFRRKRSALIYDVGEMLQ